MFQTDGFDNVDQLVHYFRILNKDNKIQLKRLQIPGTVSFN